jgi:hypothetical protein
VPQTPAPVAAARVRSASPETANSRSRARHAVCTARSTRDLSVWGSMSQVRMGAWPKTRRSSICLVAVDGGLSVSPAQHDRPDLAAGPG